jgi:hypothetical protein
MNIYTIMISKNLYKLKANRDNPKSMPTNIKKKIIKIIAKLNESIARGRK